VELRLETVAWLLDQAVDRVLDQVLHHVLAPVADLRGGRVTALVVVQVADQGLLLVVDWV
jgi:type III secretory pathway component EscU